MPIDWNSVPTTRRDTLTKAERRALGPVSARPAVPVAKIASALRRLNHDRGGMGLPPLDQLGLVKGLATPPPPPTRGVSGSAKDSAHIISSPELMMNVMRRDPHTFDDMPRPQTPHKTSKRIKKCNP